MNIPDTYELLQQERIEDVRADAYLLRHKKSGARVALLLNDDENKVFNIAFRTPPADSTGVAHILEHSVLCGSEKFPLKDPFVELAKGSLNTFLNAMTYPDKTMYPVASCNDADFRNLCDVYLDAVFHPNIYREERIFRQEGWHYHLEETDAPLTYNGVVYNEMKGVFSSSDDVLERALFSSLFPDTAYGVESGGDPANIPDLTYEAFLDFHKRYYHPSNSYIYFYGNVDAAEQLAWLDAAYLAAYDAAPVDSALRVQAPFAAPKLLEMSYPVLDDEPVEDNTYLAQATVVGDAIDVERGIAFSILEYVLLSAPGAPIKQALLDAGVGKDIEGSYDDGILQPFFSIVARGANASDRERFASIIRGTLEEIAEAGIDQKALASGINYFEFRFREADFANYPKGLIYGINLFDSWLYDDDAPFIWLKQLDHFAALKEKAKQGYFEELIRAHLLGNPHTATVVLAPERGLAAKREAELAEKLAAKKASLAAEEVEAIVQATADLAAFQEAEDPEEAVASLPMLARSDIDVKSPIRISCKETEIPIGAAAAPADSRPGTVTLLRHDFFTNGIGYLTLLFDTTSVPDDQIEYVGLLSSVLGMVETEKHSYGALFHEINARTGGIAAGLQIFPCETDPMCCRRFFGIRAKYLFPEQDFVFSMIREILFETKFEDKKRLREIIMSIQARLQNQIPAAGHASAVRRAMAQLSPMEAWQDRTGGIAYYHFIDRLAADFDARSDELIRILRELMGTLFRPANMTVSLTAGREELAAAQVRADELLQKESDTDGMRDADTHLRDVISGLADDMEAAIAAQYGEEKSATSDGSNAGVSEDKNDQKEQVGEEGTRGFTWSPDKKREAWKTAGQVQYVASAGNFLRAGCPYTGALRVLRIILSYDYLWLNIRVKGGAYGCMSGFQRTGAAYLTSYRDPHLAETLDIYRALPDYLRQFEADDRTMTRYIIGTISELDTPLNPSAKGAVSLNAHYSGLTEAGLQKERDEILACDAAAIRALAEHTSVVAEGVNVCVIGSEAAIEEQAELFDTVKALI